MPFTKITETDLQNKGVIGLPDTPGLSTTEMQEKFDEIALDVLTPKHNGLIDELALSSAAANIGALDVNNDPSTVQAELNKLKQGGYTKAETDALLANKVDTISGKGLSTNDFTDAYKDKLNGIEDNANNYVLPKGTQSTIGGVMGDGTTFTIDTNGVGHAVGGGGGGTSDYNALINKPKINNVEVIGDKSGSDFGFLSPVITITSDAGSTVKIKKGTTEIDAVPVTTTTWKAVPSDYGTWTVSSTLAGADEATGTVTVDAVKQYSVTVEHITATITATYPNDATYCTCSKGSTTYTATSNPQTFTVRATGTWTVETSLNGVVKSATTTISADGDSQSVTIEYADIEVTYDNNFKGKTITCTNGTLIYTKTAPSDANKVTFTIPNTGTWTVRSEVGGATYSDTVSVVAYTSYSATLALFNATITATFPSGASCVCNGVTATTSPYTFNLGATGTYSVVCTLDGISESTSVTITTDGQAETYTFEFGTINLTFDNEFRGLSLTCTDSISTITKNAPSTGNTMVFYPNATNTWTISGTYSGVTYTTTATVSSLSTPVSAILQTIPDGSTVTPTDVVQTWLKCAAINDKSYTTLNEVLADTDTFTALLQDSNACDYMARSTTWAKAEGLVPAMTSATTPSGECISNGDYSGQPNYQAFDKNSSTTWSSSTNFSNSYIGYTFTTPTICKLMKFTQRELYGYTDQVIKAKVQASFDGSSWTDISEELQFAMSRPSDTTELYFALNPTVAYTSYRLFYLEKVSGGFKAFPTTADIQFYADVDITSDRDAMTRIGKYDYCSYVLRNNNTWNTAITNSPYSSYIPTSPTGQTNIIHSAASDTLYYIDGTSQTIGTTDTSGVGSVTWSNVPVGNLTIYSSVANDPDDLTSAYSKTVRITPHTTEVWLMPDNALYWYGYESADLEDVTTANGWTGNGLTLSAPTHNINNILFSTSSGFNNQGIASKNTKSATKLHLLFSGTTAYGGNYGGIASATTKTNFNDTFDYHMITTSTLSHVEKTISNNGYPMAYAFNGMVSNCYALWYE